MKYKPWQIILVGLLIIAKTYAYDNKSFKRGEDLFLNHCNGCHSLQYTSYPLVSMPADEAVLWFGIQPPDLSLIAKVRGKLWLREYLTGFYPDASRPFGVNNKIFPNVQMPNVLLAGQEHAGLYSHDYLQAVDDIVDFLVYVANPNKDISAKMGVFVIGFLIVFLVFFGWFFVEYRRKEIK
ncbi:MAG: cytochrome c1 [Legionellaceae bacterium]|nr:cytochrome c1 [Legionellaceae bacterium]